MHILKFTLHHCVISDNKLIDVYFWEGSSKTIACQAAKFWRQVATGSSVLYSHWAVSCWNTKTSNVDKHKEICDNPSETYLLMLVL